MGKFIVIEGVEGAGKSTVITILADRLEKLGHDVIKTREPGGTKFGKSIRKLVLTRDPREPIGNLTELLLFAADRSHHCRHLIRPALEANKIVISDRYIYSTLAYQGYGKGIDLDKVRTINQIATEGLVPDLVLLLDIDPTRGLDRAKERAHRETKESVEASGEGSSWNYFEQRDLTFHQRVRMGLLAMAKDNPDMFAVINADTSLPEIVEQSWPAISKLLEIPD